MMQLGSRFVALLLALSAGACAAREGVPRPFPGAPLPPGARETTPPEPMTATPAPPVHATAPGVTVPDTAVPASDGLLDVVAKALGYRGVPYRFGGSDPTGFDCSGFIQYVFKQVGTLLPREVVDQWRLGDTVNRDELRPGDLVFFETVARGASHVGLAIGNDQFVHAPSSNGVVRIERLATRYWAQRWVGARRLQRTAAPAE